MGEIADDIINGDCCQYCGEYFDSEGDGYPRTCAGCSIDDAVDDTIDLDDIAL